MNLLRHVPALSAITEVYSFCMLKVTVNRQFSNAKLSLKENNIL